MAKNFHLTVARIGENIFDGEAQAVTLPGEDGTFTIMANHEAFVTPLIAGEAKIKSADGSVHQVAIPDGGIAEISNNQATVIL